MAFVIVSHSRLTSAQHGEIKRSVNDLHSTYDYVIIGGGTSGLTVANRLSENPSRKHVLLEETIFAGCNKFGSLQTQYSR